jgi:hypothetical protein
VGIQGPTGGAILPAHAFLATSQTTSSITYANLATTGPSVTVTVSSTGTAVVTVTGLESASASTASCYMSFAVSGATIVPASDTQAVMQTGPQQQGSATSVVTGLKAGSNTFTAEYRSSSSANTCHFSNRALIVTPY